MFLVHQFHACLRPSSASGSKGDGKFGKGGKVDAGKGSGCSKGRGKSDGPRCKGDVKGEVKGTAHSYIGEEAVAAAVSANPSASCRFGSPCWGVGI